MTHNDTTITRNKDGVTYRVVGPSYCAPVCDRKLAATLAVGSYGLGDDNANKLYSLVRARLATADVLTIDPAPHYQGCEFDINFTRAGDPTVYYVGFDAVAPEER